MSTSSRLSVRGVLLSLAVVLLAGPASAVEVDLAEFPGGNPVPDGTILADQWRDIGILFSARTDGGPDVDPIQQYFGQPSGNLFFSPDVFGAIAEFTFVEPGTDIPADVSNFRLTGGFMPGEASQLVGFDEFGATVDEFTTDGTANGDVVLSIEGAIRTAEWRTMGNPGIAAKELAFNEVPEPHAAALLVVGAVVLGSVRRRRCVEPETR